MQRVAIIAHYDMNERQIDLTSKKPVLAERLAKMYRWTRIEYAGALWDELSFLSHLHGRQQNSYTIWEMPIYSGLHVLNAVQRVKSDCSALLFNSIDAENREASARQIRDFAPSAVFLSTTFLLNAGQLYAAVRDVRSLLPDVPAVVGGNFIFKELTAKGNLQDMLTKLPDNVYIINSLYGEAEITQVVNQTSLCPLPDPAVQPAPSLVFKDSGTRCFAGFAGDTAYDINAWAVDYRRIGHTDCLAPVRTSIGCCFNCSFCSYPSSSGNRYLPKDMATVINELVMLRDLGVRQIVFLDDTLNVPVRRFKHLLSEMVRHGLTGFCCYCFCRCQYLDAETVALMKRCGFRAVLLGIESGADTILKNMNKQTTAAHYRPGIALLRDAGIVTFGAVIIGFPGETADTIAETVSFLNAGGLDFCYVQPFYYLHNSPVHRQRDEYGLQGEGMVWKHATMNSEECLDHLDRMFGEVTGPVYANEEYAMWELIYFHYKGFDTDYYRDYRQMINSIRAINLESREQAERCARHAPIVNGFREKLGPGI